MNTFIPVYGISLCDIVYKYVMMITDKTDEPKFVDIQTYVIQIPRNNWCCTDRDIVNRLDA